MRLLFLIEKEKKINRDDLEFPKLKKINLFHGGK